MRVYNDISQSRFLFGLRKNNNNIETYNTNFGANKFKTIAKTSHFIDNSLSASLDLPTQDVVEGIYKKLRGLKQYFEKTNFQKSISMRSKYPFIESTPILRGGYSFSLFDEEEKGKTLSIVRSKNASDIIRLVVTEKGEVENSTHYLIKGLDKVVANLNQKYPFMVPSKLRFMSAKELTDSNVVKYLVLAEKELEKYYKFLQGEDTTAFPELQQEKVEMASKRRTITDSVMRVSKTQAEMTEKIFDIFHNTTETLPKHVSPKISPSSGKVLIINLPTDDGGSLRVSKTMNPEYGDKLRYISVERTMQDGTKKFLAIDTATKKFLKLDSSNGKPMIPDGEPLFYSVAEVEKWELKELFEDTYNQIFREAKESEILRAEEVTVLKKKEPVKVLDLDEVDEEPLDFEDNKLNAIMDKSLEEQTETVESSEVVTSPAPKRRGRKPKTLTQSPAETTEIATPKRRGRKPKVKTETVAEPVATVTQSPVAVQIQPKELVSFDVENAVDIEQIRQRIIKKAEEDAEKLSQLYVDTLFAKFKENIEKAYNGVLEKFTELLKN